jgi:hypothetical protein
MKQLIALALAALLTWAFLAMLGPASGAIVRFWAGLDAGPQAFVKIAAPILCAVPAAVVLFRRRKAKAKAKAQAAAQAQARD